MTTQQMFKDYAKELGALPDVSAKHSEDDKIEEWVFNSTHPNALQVSLSWRKQWDIVSLNVEGVDCDFWHTGDEETLDYHIDLATAALKGDVAYNRSPLLKFKEVCFKLNNSWECTRVAGEHTYHYITTRKKIKF